MLSIFGVKGSFSGLSLDKSGAETPAAASGRAYDELKEKPESRPQEPTEPEEPEE